GAVCVEPPVGVHRLHWLYEFLARPATGFRVAVCTAPLGSTCDPLASPADWTRNDRPDHDPDFTLRLPCEADDCALQCPCDSSERTCESDSDCTPPAVCIEGNGPRHGRGPEDSVCEDPLCTTMATFLGCGYEGAPCGDKCSDRIPCSAGCPAGMVCGFGKGHLFGDTVADVCWHEECDVDPVGTGCGTVLSECGVCECQASCAGKVCGDDPSDGCGGFCTGLCEPREPGCTQDTDCPGGFV